MVSPTPRQPLLVVDASLPTAYDAKADMVLPQTSSKNSRPKWRPIPLITSPTVADRRCCFRAVSNTPHHHHIARRQDQPDPVPSRPIKYLLMAATGIPPKAINQMDRNLLPSTPNPYTTRTQTPRLQNRGTQNPSPIKYRGIQNPSPINYRGTQTPHPQNIPTTNTCIQNISLSRLQHTIPYQSCIISSGVPHTHTHTQT